MPLSRLDNFLKNVRGNTIYVNPQDLDATDDTTNTGNSMGKPFATIQRALLEASRFSYQKGFSNDRFGKTTIILGAGDHYVDNRPGYIPDGALNFKTRGGSNTGDFEELTLTSIFDLTDSNNILFKLNSVYGGAIIPRGTSIIANDPKKTRIRPYYVPTPNNKDIERSAIFRITGGCYIANFSIMDADPNGLVYDDYTNIKVNPNYSHHKLTAFEYADGVNSTRIDDEFQTYFTPRTDLDMYYEKVGLVYGNLSGRKISPNYPDDGVDIQTKVDEYRIVGAISGEVGVTSIRSGNGVTPSQIITASLEEGISGLNADSDFIIDGVSDALYNGSYGVQSVISQDANGNTTEFTYEVPVVPDPGNALPPVSGATVTLDVDTTVGSSPYFENITLRSVFGMSGVHADGSKVSGFKSMLFNQFTGIGLQKDDNAFVKFNSDSGTFDDKTSIDNIHADANAKYKPEYYNYHIKSSNNAFCQVVSNFSIGYSRQLVTESGGEISVTGSTSNFGQTALSASGFREDSFNKDDIGYLTQIVPPTIVSPGVLNIEYGSIDVAQSIAGGTRTKLYLYLETNKDDAPPTVIQGYRIGAKIDDNLTVAITRDNVPTLYYARIVMPPTAGSSSESTSFKLSEVARSATTGNNIVSNTITFNSNHQLENGETIRILSDNARLPDGLNSNQIYFAITSGLNADQIQIAATPNDAASGNNVQINNLGGNLTVESRVSDKIAGDIGHPIQYDDSAEQWYITCSNLIANNTIGNTIASMGTAGLGDATPRTFIQRQPASRGLDDTIYRLRYVIPAGSGITSARSPKETFMISASGDVTGATDDEVDLQFNPGSVTMDNENDMRNFSFIRKANWDNGTAHFTTELPHNISIGTKVDINNVQSTNNITGVAASAYNGTFTVTGITSANQFDVDGTSYDPGFFTNDTSARVTTLPTFRKVSNRANFYIYNVDQISEYVSGEQDGVYYLTGVTADNVPQVAPFNDPNNFSFSQPIIDLYPQFDRDNPVSDIKSTSSYALPDPLGEVVVDDLRKSVTKESVEQVLKSGGIGVGITDIISVNSITHDIHTQYDHGMNRIVSVSVASSGIGYGNSTGAIENLYNATLIGGSGSNATARVTVTPSGQISDVEIMSGGSDYTVGDTLSVTGVAVTTGITTGTVTVSKIYDNIGDTINVSGITSSYFQEYNDVYRITGISSTNVIRVNSRQSLTNYTTSGIGSENTLGGSAQLSGDVLSVSNMTYNNNDGLITVTTSTAHGLRVGNSVIINGASSDFFNNKLVAITKNVNLTKFVANIGISTQTYNTGGTKRVYRSGLFPQNGAIGSYDERFGGRSLDIYGGISCQLNSSINSSTTDQIRIKNLSSFDFKIGDYLRIDDEIMRIKTTVTGNPIRVFRGLYGTQSTTHIDDSVVRRILVPAIELRKPSSVKASSHTFEYVGYGPGNYSTALPDRQDDPPTQDEQLLSQSFRSNGGQNVYVGMNDVGDYYIGNKKISSSTGRETIFDTPLPTITGEDPSAVNVQEQFSMIESDEITISRDLIVEGGPNSDIISEFNGPVLFTQKITSTSDDGVEANSLFLQGDTNISRKYTVGLTEPTLSGNPGDIVYNANPQSGGTVGWTYTIDNGWYSFGGVSGSSTEDIQFLDKLGVNAPNLNSTGIPAVFQIGSGSGVFHVDTDGGVGIGDTANGAALRVNPALGNILGTFVGDGSGLTNVPTDSSWRNVPGKNAIISVNSSTVGIKNLNPSTSWGLHIGTNNAGTNDLLVENKSRFDGDADFNTNVNVDGTLTVKSITITNSTNNSNINSNTITTNDIEVGSNVLSAKSGGGVAIGREDARADLDVDGTLRLRSYYESATPVTSSGGVVALNLTQGQIFELIPNETINRFRLINVPASSTSTFTIKVTQGSTPRSVDILDFRNQNGSDIPVYWNGNVLPVVTPTANSTDIYTFMTFDGGATLYGLVGGQNFGDSGADPTPDDGLSFNSATQTVTITNNLDVITDGRIGRNLRVDENLIPTSDNTGNVGTANNTWANGRFTNLTIDNDLTVTDTLSVRGAIDLADNDKLRLGSSDDYQIYHDGNNGVHNIVTGNIYLRDSTSNRLIFQVSNSGIVPHVDNTGYVGTSGNTFSSGRFTNFTVDSTLSVRGAIDLADNDVIRFGTGDDFQIYHNGTDSFIDNSGRHLYIRCQADGSDDGGNIYLQPKAGENGITINDDGSVQLYHNGVEKLTTGSGGVTVAGTVAATTFSGTATNASKVQITISDGVANNNARLCMVDSNSPNSTRMDDVLINSNLSYNRGTGTLTTTNLVTTGNVTSSGSITASSVSTTGNVTSSGSITASSVSTTGNVTSSGNITASGNVTAANINSTSDISMKSDVTKIENALDIINHIDGVSFKWKDSGRDSLGVIAQTVESILPQLIHESGDIKSVNYNGLTGVLIECVKQLTKRVEELENK